MDKAAINRILKNLSQDQLDIVEDIDNNLLVTACPGSGKTRTLTRKLAYMQLRYPESLAKIIAITYTNRAANEINERLEQLQVSRNNIWVGTIHQFCLEFILRKFGLNLPRTAHGIKIIDEYTTSKYLKSIYEELGIGYNPYEHPNLKLTTKARILEGNSEKKKIVIKYHKKLKENGEIDFDLILTLALKVLEDNPIATYIISNNIRSIFIDEYQDTTEIQYKIFGELALINKSIKFMFVGDANQAIFSSLGGVSKSKIEIEKITKLEFYTSTLKGCYRSTQEIINLYGSFQQNRYSINSLAEYSQEPGVIQYDRHIHKDNLPDRISNIILKSLEKGISEDSICVIAPNQYILTLIAKELKRILPSVNFRSQDIYPIKPDNLNIFYKISFLIFTEPGKRTWLRKKIAQEVLESFKYDYNVEITTSLNKMEFLDILNSIKSTNNIGLEYLNEKIEKLFSIINVSVGTHEPLYRQKADFFSKAQERIENKRLNLSPLIDNFRDVYKTKSGINISTIHKVKGEEYEVVIAFGFLEDIVPHFKSINPDTESKKLLYVTISRAKKEIYLFSERGRRNNGYPEKLPTKILREVVPFNYYF